MISREGLYKLIDDHFHNGLDSSSYVVRRIDGRKLLVGTRFDLGFKLTFLDMMDKDVSFAKQMYTDHIRAFSFGSFVEPGNEKKRGIDRYIEDFSKTFTSIRDDGFDETKTLIPLSRNRVIANGSHRVASAIYLGIGLDCVEIDAPSHIYDYKFFRDRNVSTATLDAAATKFIEYAEGIHIAFVWPTAQKCDAEIDEIIPNIVYRKSVSLNVNGAHNLLSQIYSGESWLGSIESDFHGVKGKLVECFKKPGPIRVIAFQAATLNEVLGIKDRIRSIFDVGKHSIHITDTGDEALRVSKLVFNDNSIHFLNHAKPNRYLSTHKKIRRYEDFATRNRIDTTETVLDGGLVLALYGLRESNDIDYLIDHNQKIDCEGDDIESHDEELRYHGESKQELIYNSRYHLYFDGLKYISFPQLYRMKKNRAELKDLNDCRMMEALIDGNSYKYYANKFKQYLYYLGLKIKHRLLNLLVRINLYSFVREIYRCIRRVK